jgi:hypothetical protein
VRLECFRMYSVHQDVDGEMLSFFQRHSYVLMFGKPERCQCVLYRIMPLCTNGNARLRWLQGRERELPPTRYVHTVFTLPLELAPLGLQNKQLIYNLLFHASAEALLEVARGPRHLGAEIGFFSVLHGWNQRLQFHPHAHCVLTSGGLAPDHSRWISARRSFFLPIGVLSRVFRGKFVDGLRNAFQRGELQFHGDLLPLA